MKKSIALSLVAIAALSLSACGKKEEATASNAMNDSVANADMAADNAMNAAGSMMDSAGNMAGNMAGNAM